MGKATRTAKPAPEARFLSMAATARRLGMAPSTLCRLSREHLFYAPEMRAMPGGMMVGFETVRYHVRHVELIEAVMAGAMTIEAALQRWQFEKAQMAEALGGVQP